MTCVCSLYVDGVQRLNWVQTGGAQASAALTPGLRKVELYYYQSTASPDYLYFQFNRPSYSSGAWNYLSTSNTAMYASASNATSDTASIFVLSLIHI